MHKINFKAQSISEYAVIFSVVAVVLAGLQVFMQRGIQATVRLAADAAGNQTEGAIEEGAADQLRLRYPGYADNKRVETVGTSESSVMQTPGGNVTYLGNTTSFQDKRVRLWRELIYEDETK